MRKNMGVRGLIAVTGLLVVLLNSCSLDSSSTPPSQGSLGSCHSFVIANLYDEKLKQNGIRGGLSEKDIFLRVYFQGTTEKNEIVRQLTMSVDRRLSDHYGEGATIKQAAVVVKKYGALSRKEDPYVKLFKSSLPMQMAKLREARRAVYREASAIRSRLGRPLTRAEKGQVVDRQYKLLQSQGVIEALKIKGGNRSQVKSLASNLVYEKVNAGRSAAKLPHVISLLEQGSVGAGVSYYPWSKAAGPGAGSGHAVILKSYDAGTKEFVITNPWWLGSFGFKHYDRVNAREFMTRLETYGWLQDTGQHSARTIAPVSVAKTTKEKAKPKGMFWKLFNKLATKKKTNPAKKSAAKPAPSARSGKSTKPERGLLKWFKNLGKKER